jgi:hypothetical protein
LFRHKTAEQATQIEPMLNYADAHFKENEKDAALYFVDRHCGDPFFGLDGLRFGDLDCLGNR